MNVKSFDPQAFFKIGYGLYAVTCRDGEKDNALIVNTVMQLTDTPHRMAVAVNKRTYSHEIIAKTGKMNVNVLSEEAPFSLFEQFGFQSGRTVDKFLGVPVRRTENGLFVLKKNINAYFSLNVERTVDVDTHSLFLCTPQEAEVVSEVPTMTYSHYQAHVKPQPNVEKKNGYICKICGYVYEGESLPPDFICPWCNHGANDFEPIQ